MPVWYEQAKELVDAGALRMIGLTQEQHPDRCQLYAQWKRYDFPILWDPFNLTQASAVPIVMGVDSDGVLRATRLNARRARASLEEFLESAWPAVAAEPARPYPTINSRSAKKSTYPRDPHSAAQHGVAQLLFHRSLHGTAPTAAVYGRSLDKIAGYAGMDGSPGSARFHLGVAYRLRYDSEHRRGADFQASLDAWMGALFENPGQYIWRRRIQQWGPRLDKPYPFYDWVAQAITDVAARGEVPVVVRVPLTGSEVAGATKASPKREHEDIHPDPDGKLPRDEQGWVTLESAVALHTGITSKRGREPAGTARIHLVLRPNVKRDVHWGNEAGPTQVWVEVPAGWDVRRSLWTLPMPPDEVSSAEVRTLDFEVRPPVGSDGPPPEEPPPPAVIRGLVVYAACEGASGRCEFLAQEFELAIPIPAPKKGEDR